jgi:thiamine-monophosphate kinase
MRHRPPEGATERSRRLRHDSTDAERALWNLLRTSFPEARFRRQVPIRNFIVDFASHAAKLVIEVDGGQHEEAGDAARTALIEKEGYCVLRFWNNEVLENPEGVGQSISIALREGHPHPTLPHRRGGLSAEATFIESLRGIVFATGARGLLDDAAVLEVAATSLVITHDMIVEGVHFLGEDPADDVAWKLVAVNLSDLAAKGARPIALLLGYALATDDGWNNDFVRGLSEACRHFSVPLIGGDTVSAPAGSARTLGLTAIGEAGERVPSRGDAQPGDRLWVSGSIGDAGAGLRMAKGEIGACPSLVQRYRRPQPRLEAGIALAPLVSAMMDVSDGLLIDASRMASASGLAARIELDRVPLSADYRDSIGHGREERLAAAIAGDDYELLFATPPHAADDILDVARRLNLPLTRLGELGAGTGLRIFDQVGEVPLPSRLGYEHG